MKTRRRRRRIEPLGYQDRGGEEKKENFLSKKKIGPANDSRCTYMYGIPYSFLLYKEKLQNHQPRNNHFTLPVIQHIFAIHFFSRCLLHEKERGRSDNVRTGCWEGIVQTTHASSPQIHLFVIRTFGLDFSVLVKATKVKILNRKDVRQFNRTNQPPRQAGLVSSRSQGRDSSKSLLLGTFRINVLTGRTVPNLLNRIGIPKLLRVRFAR